MCLEIGDCEDIEQSALVAVMEDVSSFSCISTSSSILNRLQNRDTRTSTMEFLKTIRLINLNSILVGPQIN